jgi:acyl transferase domain-containing protein
MRSLLLEAGWEALAAARAMGAMPAAAMSGDPSTPHAVGTFVGISTPDYGELKRALTPIGVYSATGKTTRHPCIVQLHPVAL